MNDRIKDREPGDLARLLLESAAGDVPAAGAHARTLAALGVASTVAAASASAAAAPKAITAVTGGAIAKWMGIGASAAFLSVGTAAVVAHQVAERPEPTTAMVTAQPRAARPAGAPAPLPTSASFESLPPAPLAPVATPGEPPRDPARPGAAARERTEKSASAAESDLALEVATLDRVRAALTAGDVASAARELDAYSSRFPAAVLRPEATVLRVQTLLAAGRLADAEQLARRFVTADPKSPHAARVRLLIEGSRRPKARFED